jgi:serine/threonine protein kinase
MGFFIVMIDLERLPILRYNILVCFLIFIPSSFMQVRNEKARRYLSSMRKKQPVPLQHKFANADPLAVRLLERLLAFDPRDRPTAEEVDD